MSKVIQATIFYFSGTGNARKVASWFCSQAAKRGIECSLFNIASSEALVAAEAIDPETLVMIISPVHGFNFPKTTLDFILGMPRGHNRVVMMNTRAGMKLGRRVTPGLSGASLMLSSMILKLKGYRIVGQVPFDMPSNWITLHPALRPAAVEYLNRQNENRVARHAERIFSGQTDFRAYRDLVQDILVLPVALAYWLAGRFYLAKSLYATDACTRCGLCEKQCPAKAIRSSVRRPYWTFGCESCMRCINTCPARAIEAANGLGVVLFISSLILTGLLYKLIVPGIESGWLKFSVFSAVMFALLCLLYPLQHLLLRSKAFAKLISRTSLTHYRFWGRFYNPS